MHQMELQKKIKLVANVLYGKYFNNEFIIFNFLNVIWISMLSFNHWETGLPNWRGAGGEKYNNPVLRYWTELLQIIYFFLHQIMSHPLSTS